MNHNNVSAGYRVTVVGAVVNLALAIIKFIAGIMGHSTALVADAIHSLSDLATDLVVYMSLKISSREPDEKHPYGHGRAETIGSAVIGAAVLFVGIGVAWEVFLKARGGELHVTGLIAIMVAAASIVVKEALFRYTRRIGEKLRSESVMANAWHHRSDAVSSLAALVGITGAYMGYTILDPLAAIIVGIMIAGVGWKILWEAVQNLMDRGVSREELEKMKEIIIGDRWVVDYHELKTRKVGKDTFVDVHIQVSPRISVSEAHNIAESVRKKLRQRIDHVADALVHIDAEDDLIGRHYQLTRQETEEAIKQVIAEFPGVKIDGDMVLHFLVHKVCVDVTIAFDHDVSRYEANEIADAIAEKLLEHEKISEVTVRQNLGSRVEKMAGGS